MRKRACDKFDKYPHAAERRKNYKKAGRYEPGRFFTIQHFAGPVDYKVDNFTGIHWVSAVIDIVLIFFNERLIWFVAIWSRDS